MNAKARRVAIPKDRKTKRRVLRIEDRAYVSLGGRSAWGLCHSKLHLIEILGSLEAFDYLDTLIHEMLHYYFQKATEKHVEKVATKMANVLWDRRYRRMEK